MTTLPPNAWTKKFLRFRHDSLRFSFQTHDFFSEIRLNPEHTGCGRKWSPQCCHINHMDRVTVSEGLLKEGVAPIAWTIVHALNPSTAKTIMIETTPFVIQ